MGSTVLSGFKMNPGGALQGGSGHGWILSGSRRCRGRGKRHAGAVEPALPAALLALLDGPRTPGFSPDLPLTLSQLSDSSPAASALPPSPLGVPGPAPRSASSQRAAPSGGSCEGGLCAPPSLLPLSLPPLRAPQPCAIQLGEAGKLPERDRSCNHPASRQPEARSLGPRAREGPRGLGTAGESCEARPCQARRARR